VIEAVVFDVDGLLVQSEELWDAARRELAAAAGIPWPDDATAAMMGMSSAEWSRYMHDEVGLPQPPAEIND
jgi:beta-phosphoglucomutase-like phosphatase (HAD superfamily)